MDIIFIEDWINLKNGKIIKSGMVGGIYYKVVEELIEKGIVIIIGMEFVKLKKILLLFVEDL